MPTRRIDDDEPWHELGKPCRDPNHFPASLLVLEPGNYEHVCPGCGRITYFTIPERPWLEAPARKNKPKPAPVNPYDYMKAHGGLASVTEVARILQTSEATVRRWARKNNARRCGVAFVLNTNQVKELEARLQAKREGRP